MKTYADVMKENINFQVILGLLAFKVASTAIDKVIFPLVNIYLLDEDVFRKLNIFINKDEKKIVFIEPLKDKQAKYEIHFGNLLKELIVFFVIFTIYYFVVRNTK